MTVETETFKGIPKGYTCTESGVTEIPVDGDPKPITLKPVVVKAISRDQFSDNWGTLVWWTDLDGEEHERAFPKQLYHTQGTELVQLLAREGLPLITGREKALLNYLAKFEVENRLIAASCTGWLGEAFVLPDETLNEPPEQRIVYQPSGLSNTAKAIGRKGTLADWQAGMSTASPMVIFYICAALSSPVRYKAGIEAGGFHAYDLTSQGKTTMLQAAASVWGNGSDPAIAGGAEVYIQRWNATANALEAKAETFNDLVLAVDEIGEGDPKEFGRTIYRILSGSGRGRSDRSGGLRDSKSWRVTILSAGEIAISEYIESGGGKVKGGQLVRMVDLDLANIGKLFDSAEDANAMKALCAAHYGHAGPAMLEKVTDLAADWSDFDHPEIGEAVTEISIRVRARFALVAYTGHIAVNAGILPWTRDQIIDAVKAAYTVWHDASNSVSDIDRGVTAVRDFILKHESRFEVEVKSDMPPRDRAGWKRDNMFHFTPAAFKEACNGADSVKVKKALKESRLLHFTKGLNSNIRVNGQLTPVTSVLSSITSIGSSSPRPTIVSTDTTKDTEVVSVVSPDTTDTTCKTEVGSAESHIKKGLLPPIPPIPPNNSDMGVVPSGLDEVEAMPNVEKF